MTHIRKKPLTLTQFNEARVRGDQPYERAGYVPQYSAKFDGSTGYLSWTPSVIGNRQKFTISLWLKIDELSDVVTCRIFNGTESGTGAYEGPQISGNALGVRHYTAPTFSYVNTSSLQRDLIGRYHICFSIDTTQVIDSDRVKIYVNGVEQPLSLPTYPVLNYVWPITDVTLHSIGAHPGGGEYLNGEMADFIFIDGQALLPTDFGEFTARDGWMPNEYEGTYGANGFHLKFDDPTNLGKDSSGNENHWTVNGGIAQITRSIDDVTATLNPLYFKGAQGTYSSGNLTIQTSPSVVSAHIATFGVSSGEWYWEFVPSNVNGVCLLGVSENNIGNISVNGLGQASNGWAYSSSNGNMMNNNSSVPYGSTYTAGDVIGVRLNMDTGELEFYKNGVSQGVAFSGLSGTLFPAVSDGGDTTFISGTFKFKSNEWMYPPIGINSRHELSKNNVAKTQTTFLADHFVQGTYIGNGTSQSINFQDRYGNAVDLGAKRYKLHIKHLSTTYDNEVYDSLRGVTKRIRTNSDSLEETVAEGVTAMTGTGFTVGNHWGVNQPGNPFVYWVEVAGETTGTDTTGSITSTVTAGDSLSIVVVENASPGGTVGHRDSAVPKQPAFIVGKRLGAASNWPCWHKDIHPTSGNGNTVYLNLPNADGVSGVCIAGVNSTTFTLGGDASFTGRWVFYVYYESDFCRVFSYTGNGNADGPYCDLKGAPVYHFSKKPNDATNANWLVFADAFETANPRSSTIRLNLPDAVSVGNYLDYTANGHKARVSSTEYNQSGSLCIGLAFVDPLHKHRLMLGR